MDRILIILKKENGPRASSAPALGFNTIIFKHVYWCMQQISGERLQDQTKVFISKIFKPLIVIGLAGFHCTSILERFWQFGHILVFARII